MLSLKKLLGKEKPNSKELRGAIAGAEEALTSARSDLDALNAKLPAVLLEEDDTAADDLEAKITGRGREVKRLEIGLRELHQRVAVAESREAKKALDRQLGKAEAAASRGVGLIGDYGQHADAIAKILVELSAIDQVVLAANAAAAAAGDDRRVETPNEVFRKVPDEIIPEHTKTLVVDLKAAERGGLTFKDGIRPKPRLVNIPEKVVKGASRPALQADVVLPSAGSSGETIWPAHDHAARMAIKDQVRKRAGKLAA